MRKYSLSFLILVILYQIVRIIVYGSVSSESASSFRELVIM